MSSKSRALAILCLVLAGAGAGCTQARRHRSVEFFPAPASGEVAPLVNSQQQRAGREGRPLLVYVGASWCEPCQRFHRAATEGKFDAAFPGLRLVEFDADRDGERLATAGYVSRFIPLFARPAGDGRSSGRQTEGAVSGEAVVDDITPRLRQLLND